MTVHNLKIWPQYFEPKIKFKKPWELRREDDRRYNEGDYLKLSEWNPETRRYTGRWCVEKVISVLRGSDLLAPGVVLMTTEFIQMERQYPSSTT